MKLKNKKLSASGQRLIAIIESLTGTDPTVNSRNREFITARIIAYKILRDNEEWTFAQAGSLFGKDHATARHGYISFDYLRHQDTMLDYYYKKTLEIYQDKEQVIEQLEKSQLHEKLLEKEGEINGLKSYIEELKKQIVEMKEDRDNYGELFDIIKMRVPAGKKETAAKRINATLNSI
jgi:DNA-binding protein H-NS